MSSPRSATSQSSTTNPLTANPETVLNSVKFDEKGLAGCIVQDAKTGEVLMFAWMNRESLGHTLATGHATYWSRSRGKLWIKGETSGHYQHVRDLRIDCDADAILIKVDQEGGACHTGHRSCFYRSLEEPGTWREEDDKVFDAKAVYGEKAK